MKTLLALFGVVGAFSIPFAQVRETENTCQKIEAQYLQATLDGLSKGFDQYDSLVVISDDEGDDIYRQWSIPHLENWALAEEAGCDPMAWEGEGHDRVSLEWQTMETRLHAKGWTYPHSRLNKDGLN